MKISIVLEKTVRLQTSAAEMVRPTLLIDIQPLHLSARLDGPVAHFEAQLGQLHLDFRRVVCRAHRMTMRLHPFVSGVSPLRMYVGRYHIRHCRHIVESIRGVVRRQKNSRTIQTIRSHRQRSCLVW